MTDHQAAVQIVTEALALRGYGPDLPSDFHAALDALAAADLLAKPGEVAQHEADLLAVEAQRADLAERLFAQEDELAALRAVADAARAAVYEDGPGHLHRLWESVNALDALPPADGAPVPPQGEDAGRQREWHALPEQCYIAGCDSDEIDHRGPVSLRDGSIHKACVEHWEGVFRVLGEQASWGRTDGALAALPPADGAR